MFGHWYSTLSPEHICFYQYQIKFCTHLLNDQVGRSLYLLCCTARPTLRLALAARLPPRGSPLQSWYWAGSSRASLLPAAPSHGDHRLLHTPEIVRNSSHLHTGVKQNTDYNQFLLILSIP